MTTPNVPQLPSTSASSRTIAPAYLFRPPNPAEHGPEPVYRVRVRSVVPIAGTTLAACQDRDAPYWHYEVLTTKPVAVGDTGTVHVVAWARHTDPDRVHRIKPKWALTLDEPTEASTTSDGMSKIVTERPQITLGPANGEGI